MRQMGKRHTVFDMLFGRTGNVMRKQLDLDLMVALDGGPLRRVGGRGGRGRIM